MGMLRCNLRVAVNGVILENAGLGHLASKDNDLTSTADDDRAVSSQNAKLQQGNLPFFLFYGSINQYRFQRMQAKET